ncbi:MAG: M20 family peptidase [Candidatus Hydrogenedentes bacterium]|nr:M20 family peptidase [Candidatus Hydrogenedentota bacterium]
MIKRILILLVLVVGGVAALLVVRTLSTSSRQVHPEPVTGIELDTDAVVARLAEAITHRTISHQDPEKFDSAAFLQFHSFLERSFPKVHATLKKEVVSDYSLLYHWEGSDPSLRPILLLAHMDVVPVAPGTHDDWEHDAFSGDLDGGFVWGRGTLDDKVNLMAVLEAVERLLSEGVQPVRPVYLAFGHDEEIGGANGAEVMAKLLEDRGVRAEFVMDEGGAIISGAFPGLSAPLATIGIAEKGYTSVQLYVRAKGGHSSQPLPESAIGMLSAAVLRVEQNQLPSAITGPTRTMLEYMGPESSFVNRLIMANLWLFSPVLKGILEASPASNAMIRTTTAPTMFNAGVKENVLPAEARAVINFRILPGDTVESVMEHVRVTIDDPRIEVSALTWGADPSKVSPIDVEGFKRIETTIRELFPEAIVAPYLVIGGTDARAYEAICENIYRFSPLLLETSDLARMHGTNERIAIEDYTRIIQFYYRLLVTSTS